MLSLTLLLFTACRTVRESRAGVSGLTVSEVNKILYANIYYEFEEPPSDLRYSPEKSDTDLVLHTLQIYSQDSFFILYHFMHELPLKMKNNEMIIQDTVKLKMDFMRWADTESRLALACSIKTIVHECCHGITSNLMREALKKTQYKSFSSGF
jgi:hypothetical protein